MSIETLEEARRQVNICNACRYCEGYCSVFPAINAKRQFSDGDITQLANLCHGCRGCFYACQYTEPHEFAINLPRILDEVRQDSWQEMVYPKTFARSFHRHGVAIALALIAGIGFLIWAMKTYGGSGGDGFYALMSHNVMVALFLPAFLLPFALIAASLRSYWRRVDGQPVKWAQVRAAFASAAAMKNLSGGHGDGCNFEEKERFTRLRKHLHHATMYGFLLCFAATSVATLMHYVFDMPAPYGPFDLPKLLGVPGGILLSLGTLGLAALKLKADKDLSDRRVWGGEMAFVLLLFFVSTSGLALYYFGQSVWLAELLAVHLGSVFAFFLLTPYTKMVHGFFRLAALVRDAQR
ncbi:MAG: tricarballylate utilization 4Fe-4S protein TcuB [Rhodospirillales bacterium]|nr:tricarballylate utilization 4Fe-4S protein TcuB [Rhodospirillales bacterium]